MRGGWRLLIYATFVAGLGFGGGIILQYFIHPTRGVFSLGYSFTFEVFSFMVVFGAALIMSRIEGRSPGAYGLPLTGAFGKLFWQGSLIGLVEISVLMGLIAAFGGYSFGGLALQGKEMLRWGILVSGIHAIHTRGQHRFLARRYCAFVLVWGRSFRESRRRPGGGGWRCSDRTHFRFCPAAHRKSLAGCRVAREL